MTDSAPFVGRCGCGQIEYAMQSEPMFVHCCHCTWCQRETGTAFALNAIIESDRVSLLCGSPAAVQTPSESGKGQVIVRCPHCQVALWSHYAGAGDAVCFVRVGTLDQPQRFTPDIHIYTRSKQPWISLPSEVPAVESYYKVSEYWPESSLARRAALRAKSS